EERDEAEPAEEEEEVSEEEDITENDEDFVPTDKEESSDEEEPPETEDIFQSKDGNILWSSIPPSDRRHILGAEWRAKFSFQFVFTDTHVLVSYHPKQRRNVLLMSTLHRDTSVSATEDKKPQIILDYNKNKGGVDNLDKVTSVYSCKRMTARWLLTVFYNMLDVSAYNSFVLWREIDPSWNRGKCHNRRLFLEELGRELVTPLLRRRQVLPRTPASARLVMEVLQGASTSAAAPLHPAAPPRPSAKRRRCQFCTNDTKTSTRCQKCDAHIFKTHSIITCHSSK
ncbi:hypothetical protein QTP86_025851, partial [Hemibagrus guttatus]